MTKFEIKTVGVIGSGIMGSGIAEVISKSGIDVVIRSRSAETAQATKAAIEASLNKQIAKQNLSYEQSRLKADASILARQYSKYLASLQYYDEFALPQAATILDNAEKSYRAGDIDYVEFVMGSSQAWQVREAWADNIAAYNETIIAIEHLAGIE